MGQACHENLRPNGSVLYAIRDTCSRGIAIETWRTNVGHLLDVNTDFETLDEESDFFSRAGVDMIRCLGPDTCAGCPVLNGEDCPKVSRATVIISQLDLENEGHREVLRTYRKSGATVIAVVSPEDNERWASELINVETIVGPPTQADLQRIAAGVASSG